MPTGVHPPQHLRITYSGVLGAAAEIWSFGLNAIETGFTTKAVLKTLADGLQLAWEGAGNDFIGSEAFLTRTRVASVGSNGLVRKDAAGEFQQEDSVVQASGGSPQTGSNYAVALAISTQSNFAGATGRGRFFLPVPELGGLVNGRMSVGQQDAIAGKMQAFLRDINGRLSGAGHGPLAIASAGSASKGIAPGMRPITSVRVGRVPDTIRSRRNALGEAYISVAV